MNKESLLQLRRSVVMEMFLCKKKIEDNTDSIQDNKAEVYTFRHSIGIVLTYPSQNVEIGF